MEITRLRPNGIWDSTPYNFSQAVRISGCQDMLFIAGQAGIDANGQVVDGLEAQIRLTFDNIQRVVADAGGTMAYVIRITGYLRDMNALPIYTKIVGEIFGAKVPAATLVAVKALALEPLLVEVD